MLNLLFSKFLSLAFALTYPMLVPVMEAWLYRTADLIFSLILHKIHDSECCFSISFPLLRRHDLPVIPHFTFFACLAILFHHFDATVPSACLLLDT